MRLLLDRSRLLIDKIRSKAAHGGINFYAPVNVAKLYKMLENSEYRSWHFDVNDRGTSPQKGTTNRQSPEFSSIQKQKKAKHRILGIPENC